MKLFDFNHDGNTDFFEEMMGLHIVSSALSEVADTDDLGDAVIDGALEMDDEAEDYEDEDYEDEDEDYEEFDDLEGDYDDVSDLF